MARELLLDTGPFVALVDRSEANHADCVAVLEDWSGLIVTTEAVLTETLQLVGPSWDHQQACLAFILRGAVTLVPTSETSIRRVATLMGQYEDVPMDFADGTVVALGEDLGTGHVFTLDRQGFSAYRLNGKMGFEIYP